MDPSSIPVKLLGVISFITSGTASFFNTGLESLVLVIWGPNNSRGVIAVYHFFFTFGGFLAPLLVGLFKSTEDPLKSESNNDSKLEYLEILRTI